MIPFSVEDVVFDNVASAAMVLPYIYLYLHTERIVSTKNSSYHMIVIPLYGQYQTMYSGAHM